MKTNTTLDLPPAGRSALRAGVVGNWIDNIHVFLPLTALAPAMATLAGPTVAASTGAVIVIAMLLGRPLGGLIFGKISDRIGRTRTTRIAIAGTAACTLGIAATPTHELLGPGTIALILIFRFVGGIFVAGEYSAAIPLAMEWSPARSRGFMSGFILSMAPWAQASIAFAVAGLLTVLGPENYAVWGWRALFVIGGLLSIGMYVFYTRNVADAPIFHRQKDTENQQTSQPKPRVLGSWTSAFWQVFIMMTGLWLLTDSTVLLLTDRLGTDTPLVAEDVSFVIGIASVAQAFVMIVAGHLSTFIGRRSLLIVWGSSAATLGPFIWWAAMKSSHVGQALILASLLQVVTVSAYGPIAAYLSERFPTEIRSTGYGMGYSLSLILPALYPFYLPWIESPLGRDGSVIFLIVLGGVLVVFGAARGPRFNRSDIDQDLDHVAWAAAEQIRDSNAQASKESVQS